MKKQLNRGKSLHVIRDFKTLPRMVKCFFTASLLILVSFAAQSQSKVTGTVKDELGEPLIGVSVQIQNTTSGTTTNVNGQFSIDVAANNQTLVFSYLGYTTQEVAINNRTVVDIILKPNDKSLDEVVVIGYGTIKKRDVSTSTVTISANDLKDQPVAGFDQAIAGKAAGVRVSAGNAAPGAGQSVIIRGMGSISASSAPLYVIDGMPLPDSYDKNENPLNAINPSDIESIQILKDASSSAIYGARASNGVVLITTKRGKSGKPTISFNANQGIQGIINNIEVLDRSEFLQFISDSRSQAYVIQDPFLWDDKKRSYTWDTPDAQRLANLKALNREGINSDPRIERWFVLSDNIKNNMNDVNWMDEITQLGRVQDYQLSASGGNEGTTYRISGNYFDQKGLVKASGYKRYGARGVVDIKLNDNIKVGLNLAPSYEIFDKLDKMEGNDGPNGFFGTALAMPPIFAPFDAAGKPAYLGSVVNGPYDFDLGGQINPYSLLAITTNGYNFRNIGSVYGDVKFLKDFNFRSELNTEIRNRTGEYFSPTTVPTTSTPNSRSVGVSEAQNRIYLNTQNILSYVKQLKQHAITAVVGFQAEKTTYKDTYLKKLDFFVDDITALANSSTIDNPLNDVRTNPRTSTMLGVFTRLLYNFNSRYYLTASFRRDGSSKFGPDNKYGNFPSFSAAWRISDEPFMKGIKKVVSDWKIRSGWGKVGNSSIADYLALNRLATSDYTFGGTTASYYIGTNDVGIPYTQLGWESTEDFNIATDVTLLNGRVDFTYEYFNRKTTDMLYNVALVGATGFSSQTRNISAMRNRGMEFTVNSKNLIGTFKWNTNFNISYVRNKVLDLGPQKNPLIGTDTRSEEGKPLSNIFGFSYLHPYRDWEEVKTTPIIYGATVITRSVPGDGRYADVNMDGIIDVNDYTVIGNPQPDFVFGMNNAFAYKRFDMNVQLSGVVGGDINLRSFRRNVFGGNSGTNNVPQFFFDNYWRPDRPDAKYEAPNRKSYTKQFTTSSQNIEKGTFLNINNVTLGYTIPTKVLSRYKISNCRLYLSVQNAFMFTGYHGFNPEANVAGIDARTQGTDETSYPLARTASFGLNLSF
ncbi:SusC/RagA family TonB-linked outer membrane protein [Pedobacter glucosidilyticus]|uniref:SusC/RagA family TonB-linked outer membrane protein n=1 Tax=Pedobacter glucosidilyticus TaxID=1122941 RepID=UPI0026F14967|nr:TonB-dependent receptor [Pedobacter glucosidilyticus]